MKYLPLFFVVFLLPGCSQSKLMRLMTKSPEVDPDRRQMQGNKYQQDAYYLAAVIRDAYPRLEDKMTAAEFEVERERLVQACAHIVSGRDFELEIQRFMAKLKDGHSRLTSVEWYFDKTAGRYSLRLFREGDRFLISHIDYTADSTLIGNALLAVNGIPVKTIQERILALESAENEYFAYTRFLDKVTNPGYWKALGVTSSPADSLTLTTQDARGNSVIVRLAPKPQYRVHVLSAQPAKHAFTKRQNNGFFYKILEEEQVAYLQMNTCLDYVAVKSEIGNYTNFITKPLALSAMKKRTKNAPNFGLVLQQLFTEIQAKNIKTLVLDLRYNSGGDERLGKQFLWYLTDRTDIKGFQDYYQLSAYFKQQVKNDFKRYARQYKQRHGAPLPADTLLNVTEQILGSPAYFDDIEKPGSPFLLDRSLPKFEGAVYVLTGPQTFSAAQVLATTLQDNGLATIVGAPTGNKPSAQTGASLFKLPNTGLILSLSYLYMERPDTRKNREDALYPDVRVERTLEKVQAGHDEPFEWILEQAAKASKK